MKISAEGKMKKKDTQFDRFMEHFCKYMKANGWSVIVAGDTSVRTRPPLKFNYTFQIEFTGRKL